MDTDKWTDKELERLEKRIQQEYEKAQEELGQKAQDYFLQYEDRFKREELAMLTSSLTKDEVADKWADLYGSMAGFDSWFKTADHAYGQTAAEASQKFKQWEYAQLGRGQHWYDLRDQMAERLTQTNQIAAGYTNGILPKIYIANSNGVAAIAEEAAMKQGVAGVRFDLVDEYTVRRLMMESSDVRPYKPVDVSIIDSTQWSKNKIQNALLQSVLQGDSIDDFADRLQSVTNMNRSAAVCNARTATTYAQSKGKLDRFEDLAKKGVIFNKVWQATHDARTRPEHAEADGQEVDYNSTFDVGGEDLRCPSDPRASGWNRYNCRCTMRAHILGFKSIMSEEDQKKANIRIKGDSDTKAIKGTKLDNILSNYGRTDLDLRLKDIGNAAYEGLQKLKANCKNANLVKLFDKYADNIRINQIDAVEIEAYNRNTRAMRLNVVKNIIGDRISNAFEVIEHETAHGIDHLTNRERTGNDHYFSATYKNGIFAKTMKKEGEKYLEKLAAKNMAVYEENKNNESWLAEHFIKRDENGNLPAYTDKLGKEIGIIDLYNTNPSEYAALIDILDGASNGTLIVPCGHGAEYWNEDPENYAAEGFASFSASELANRDSMNVLMRELPESYNIYIEMLGVMAK